MNNSEKLKEIKNNTNVEHGEVQKISDAYEDPFGDEEGAGVKYKTMTWLQTAFIMIAETVSLGILSIPSTLKVVGLVPGIVLLVSLGVITTYTGYVLGQFKLRYPHVHSFAEAGGIVGGRIGYEIFAGGQLLFLVFVMGAHILSFSIMMNVLTEHAACTMWFTIAGFGISLICTLPRTMKAMSHLSYISSASVVAAVLVCMVGVAVSGKDVTVRIFNSGIALYEGFGAVTHVVFAYAGHVAFFSLFSEMKDPREFHKSLFTLQICDTILYTITATVIYRFTGDSVVSPALGSAGPLLSKVAYGIALPTIIISGVINGHVAVKYLYIRMCSKEMIRSRSWKSYSIWVAILSVLWVVAWVIASAVPIFNNLLGLISALFLSWFTYGISGYLWLYMHKGEWFSTKWNAFLTVINVTLVLIGCIIMSLGLYSSSLSIMKDNAGACFSCADNSI